MWWWELRQCGLGADPMSREFGRLIKQVRAMLSSDGVPSTYRDIGREVLEATARAHRERNLWVHDLWVHLPWSADESIRSHREGNTRQFDDLRACAAGLLDLLYRLRALAVITPPWFGREAIGEMGRSDLVSWTRVAMGHIDRSVPHQIVGTDGHAPLPPGW